MNKKEREIVFEAIAKKNNSRSNYFIKGLFSFLFFKDLSSVEVGYLLTYVWFVVFHKVQMKNVSWKMCIVDEQSQWHQWFQWILVLRELQNSSLLSSKQAHVSLSYLSLFLDYGQTFSKSKDGAGLCHVLACSEINCVPYDKELDYDPSFPSFRPLSSNLHLGCFGLCWWPDCEKFNIALLVPGPSNSLLF